MKAPDRYNWNEQQCHISYDIRHRVPNEELVVINATN